MSCAITLGLCKPTNFTVVLKRYSSTRLQTTFTKFKKGSSSDGQFGVIQAGLYRNATLVGHRAYLVRCLQSVLTAEARVWSGMRSADGADHITDAPYY